jgi:small subunit ribosomal protein S4
MATITEPKCKLCRREGIKLFLKGMRCETAKCGVSKRNYPPGERHWRRGKPSEYGAQLREKQKVRRMYGVLERTFHLYYEKATKTKGATGVALMLMLERRLDNALYRSCFAASRRQARSFVSHKHITVNGRRIDRVGYQVKAGDVIAVDQDMLPVVKTNQGEVARARTVSGWLQVDPDAGKMTVNMLPRREDIPEPVQEQWIVELYGK